MTSPLQYLVLLEQGLQNSSNPEMDSVVDKVLNEALAEMLEKSNIPARIKRFLVFFISII